MVSPYTRRIEHRWVIYVFPPDGRCLLWDDCDTAEEAEQIAKLTCLPYDIIDYFTEPTVVRSISQKLKLDRL